MSETTRQKALIFMPGGHKGTPHPPPSTPTPPHSPLHNKKMSQIQTSKQEAKNRPTPKKNAQKTRGCPSDQSQAATTQSSLQGRCHPSGLPQCPGEFPLSRHGMHQAPTRPHTTSDWPNRHESDFHECQGPQAAPHSGAAKLQGSFSPAAARQRPTQH